MSSADESRESSYVPLSEDESTSGAAEERVFVYNPQAQAYRVGSLLDEGDDEDDDDDDMDYEPAEEGIDGEEEEMDEAAFEDASEDLSGVEIEFEVAEDDEVTTDDQGESQAGDHQSQVHEGEAERATVPQLRLSRHQFMELLGHNNLRQFLASRYSLALLMGGQDEEEDDDGSDTSTDGPTARYGLRSGTGARKREAPTIDTGPSEEGQRLMASGRFGTNVRPSDSIKSRKRVALDLLKRELGLGTPGSERSKWNLQRQDFVPSSKAEMIINYNDRCYSGQFSRDGNFFFSCVQDFKVRMYDTSNPYDWKYYKTVDVPLGQWTITDATLSPDNRFLAASSIQNVVTLASTDPSPDRDADSQYQMLDFAQMSPTASAGGQRGRWGGYGRFGIWSLRFSGDGREIIAGTGDNSVYVYDLERRQSILRIPGHYDDVNAVCYGDENSPHILYSGSDDTTLKVWDRRSLGEGRAAGVFLGHTEGLTYVDSKGDGRYVLSNGKDQTTKLWDLRKTIATEDAGRINHSGLKNFDYRRDNFNFSRWRPHPSDCSLVTFRGHRILCTLIRCHFSPPRSSDGRYVYSGSQDGKVWIWNLDGTVKSKVDVFAETKNTRPKDLSDSDYRWGRSSGPWRTVVRDASWHPDVGMIAATSWNGYGQGWGTCTVHSWDNDYESAANGNEGDNEDEAAETGTTKRKKKQGSRTARRVNARLMHDDEYYRHERQTPTAAAAPTTQRSTWARPWRRTVVDSESEGDSTE